MTQELSLSDRVPEGWNVRRLKYTVTSCKNGVWGDEPGGDENDIVCVRVADFDRTKKEVSTKKLTIRSISPADQATRRLSVGDLLLEKSGGGDQQPVGSVVRFDLDITAVCSNFVASMSIAQGYDSQFLCYLHAALYEHRVHIPFIKQTTGIQNLDADDYLNQKFAFPPLPEQRAIADFLDRETTQIDTLVAEKKRHLVLLAEKRRALITEAVTRGLDPTVPLRDSGQPWLGEIPAHWKPIRLKFVADVRSGVAKGRDLDKSKSIQVPYLRVANVQDGFLNLNNVPDIEILPHELENYLLMPGDVLMNEGGDSDKLGRGAIWDGSISPCIHQNHVFAVRCFGISPAWLTTFTGSEAAKSYFESRAKQTTNLASISSTNIQELVVPLPPPDEQHLILNHIQTETNTLDALRKATEHSIELLKERRAALIAAAVTGQIPVIREKAD